MLASPLSAPWWNQWSLIMLWWGGPMTLKSSSPSLLRNLRMVRVPLWVA